MVVVVSKKAGQSAHTKSLETGALGKKATECL